MTDITNEQRAAWAAQALLQYAISKEGGAELYDDTATVLTDMLCDLMHHAAAAEVDLLASFEMAKMHYAEEIKGGLGNQHGLCCPECGKSEEIDIAAHVWVRLCPDGTDVTAAHNGDHEWQNDNAAHCCACGHCSTVAAFEVTP